MSRVCTTTPVTQPYGGRLIDLQATPEERVDLTGQSFLAVSAPGEPGVSGHHPSAVATGGANGSEARIEPVG